MPNTARLNEFSDREFLHLMQDVHLERKDGKGGGWVTTGEIAERITGITDQDDDRLTDARRGCGSRLAWMRRFGVVDRDPETGAWRINGIGQAFLSQTIRRQVEQGVSDLKPHEMVEVMLRMASHYRATGRETAIMMRREFQRGTGVR